MSADDADFSAVPDWQGLARSLLADEAPGAAAMPPFGDYVLEEEIARGGMGIVYRARQVSLDRAVAVKVMREGVFADGKEVLRFRQEAEAAAALRHPGIVPVHEAGEEGGRCFYAMEWVEGRDLAEATRSGPVSAGEAARWVCEVAGAIAHAHARGVIHRDLKPANVLLDREGRTRVTDFGMAQRADTAGGLTLSGHMLGTPGYMAPEVAGGKARTAGEAADIYGLGALLFHLLTGRAPFIGESHGTILRQVVDEDPVSPRLLNGSVPRDLETICLKSLQREPGRRYRTAEGMADDLRRFLTGEPIHARPIGACGRAVKWCRRKPALAASLAAFGLALSGGCGGILWQWRVAEAAKTAAESSAESRRLSLYAADMPQVQRAVAEGDFFLARHLLEAHRPAAGQRDLRGWEWRHFWQAAKGDQVASLYTGRPGVTGVVYARNGAYLAGCSIRPTVWDAVTRQVLATGPKEELTSIDFSVDGETLYLGSVQARLSAWRWREPGAPVELGRPAGGLVRVVASPSGRVLAVGAGSRQNGRPDGVVTLHDAETGALLRSLPESGGFAAFSPDGAWLATGSWKGKVTLWNADDGSVVATFGGLNFVTSLRFSGDSRRLVVSRAEGACQIVDVATGMRRSGTPGYVSEVWDAALSPGGDRLATVSLDQSVRVWDAESGAERARFLGHERGVGQVAWAPEGQILATGGADGMVRLWSPAKNDPSVVGFPGKIGRMAFSRDGRHFVLQEQPGRVAVYRRADGMRLGEAAAGEALGILPAVDSLVCAARGGEAGEPWKIHFWSVPALVREKTMDLPGTEAEFHHLQVSPDGRWIAGYSDSGRARVWDLAAGARLIEVTEQIPHPVVAMALLTDPPRLIAAASQHPYLWLFSLPDGVAGGTMDYPGGAPNWLLPSRDGESLFVSSTDGTMRKWDVVDRKSQWQFAVKPGVLALSPDGLTLACATPGAVRLWNVETRREVARFSAKPVVHTVAFSPDGRALLFSESDPGQAPVTRMLMAPDIGQTESRPE